MENNKMEKLIQKINKIQEEFNNKVNDLKTQINNYNNNANFNIHLVPHVGESEEDYLEKGEGIVDQTTQIIQLNDLILEKENEIKEIIETSNRKMNNIFTICRENRTTLVMKQKDNLDKIIQAKKNIIDKSDKTSQEKRQLYENYKEEMQVNRFETSEMKEKREVKEMLEEIKEERMKMSELIVKLEEVKKDLSDKGFREEDVVKMIKKYDEKKKIREERKEKLKGIITSNEIEKLEQMSETEIGDVIFDSKVNNWEVGSSEFDEIVFNKEKLVFLIQDNENNLFGGYINAKIDQYEYEENNEWKGDYITDPNAFIFSLRNNGRSSEMIKMNIKKEKADWAFSLYKKNDNILFYIGGDDITIMKESYKNQCSCIPESFEYPTGKENILVGKMGDDNEFEVKRIIVIQMYETEELKQMKEERKNKQLKENNVKIQEEYKNEISQIEKWSETKCKEMIFDSEVNDWNINTSEFNDIIFEKEKLVFIIEDENNNVFGGYIKSKIDKYQYRENNEWKGDYITDPNAFIFSLRNNGRNKGMIKMNIRKELCDWAFTLFKKEEEGMLFGMGRSDLIILKECYKNKCYHFTKSFEYPEGKENILIGKTGRENPFSVKRIIVLQME